MKGPDAFSGRTTTDGLQQRPKLGWLRSAREARGWPRQKVADALGVTAAAVRDYEVAELNDAISLRTLKKVADVLGCEVLCALVPKSDDTARQVDPPATAPFADEPPELEQHLR